LERTSANATSKMITYHKIGGRSGKPVKNSLRQAPYGANAARDGVELRFFARLNRSCGALRVATGAGKREHRPVRTLRKRRPSPDRRSRECMSDTPPKPRPILRL